MKKKFQSILFSSIVRTSLVVSFFTIFIGCGESNFPKSYQLGGLRVLAMKANTPEVSPGDTVTIHSLVTDLNGEGRELSYRYEACTDPGVTLGASPSCDHDPLKQTSSGTHRFSNSRYTGEFSPINVTIPTTVLDQKTLTDQMNGVSYLVKLNVSALNSNGESQEIVAFRRILVSALTKNSKNQNPTLTEIQQASASILQLPVEEKTLSPVILPLDSKGAEEYFLYAKTTNPLELGVRSPQTEKMTVSWFVSQGKVQYSRTEPSGGGNLYTPASPANSSKPEFLIIVVHDDRGGVSYLGVPSL